MAEAYENLPPEGKIERAQRNLYSRDPKGPRRDRFGLPKQPNEIAEDWPHSEEEFMKKRMKYRFLEFTGRSPFVKGFLIFSLVFFLAAAVFAFFQFYRGSNIVSSENVSIGIAGPTSVPAGEKLPLEVVVTNNNSAPLTSVDLRVTYPAGTRDPADLSKELLRDRELLGEIEPGGEARKKI